MSLSEFVRKAKRLVVLTGAGCSTESGIPDYRSPGGAWTRHKPIQYSAFVRSAEVRRFYWARSFRGWPRFEAARPNRAHRALAELESRGSVHQLITQNVDDLHQEAGSRAVVQLHGRNRLVVCLDCGAEFPRVAIQEELAELNRDWLANAPWEKLNPADADFAPDGDADVGRGAVDGFRVARHRSRIAVCRAGDDRCDDLRTGRTDCSRRQRDDRSRVAQPARSQAFAQTAERFRERGIRFAGQTPKKPLSDMAMEWFRAG